MKRISFFLLFLFLLPIFWADAQEDRADQPLPAPYQNDRILAGSVSPDGSYGLIHPKEEILDDPERAAHLLLVAVKPFRVLTEISPDINLLRGHGSYSVNWAKDSSAVLVNVQSKWGPDSVFLVPIHNGRAGKVADLVPVVEKFVRPVYRHSKSRRHGKASVERFNDELDFIFERDYGPLGSQESVRETWSAQEPGKVAVTCFCTNNPKIPDTHTWAARFDGVWDIARGRFTRRKVSLLHPPPDKLED